MIRAMDLRSLQSISGGDITIVSSSGSSGPLVVTSARPKPEPPDGGGTGHGGADVVGIAGLLVAVAAWLFPVPPPPL